MEAQSQKSQNPYASPIVRPIIERVSTPLSLNKPSEPLVQPIRISVSLSLQEYYSAVRLARKPFRWFALLYFVVLLLLHVICVFYRDIINGEFGMVVLALFYISVFVLFFYWLRKWSLRARRDWHARKAHAAGTGIFISYEMIIFEDHYEVITTVMEAKVQWSFFCMFRDSDRLVMLYHKEDPLQYSIIPRSKFQSQHDWECFIGLLDRKLPRC
jgi:hypothetical protein